MWTSPVTVFLRMGHSLGKLKDRYVFQGDGADQLCGRTICLLDINSERFGTLPEHFSKTVLANLDESFWISILPDYVKYPACFRLLSSYRSIITPTNF